MAVVNEYKIKNFKELLSSLFYDWKMTPKNPQLKQSTHNEFWVNKTTIFIKEGKAYLNYKTSTSLIAVKAYQAFLEFYTHFYVDDFEFQDFLDDLDEVWWHDSENEKAKDRHQFINNSLEFKMADLVITKNSDGSGTRTYKNESKTYSPELMEKIDRFCKMIK